MEPTRESNTAKQLWYLTLKNFKSMIREKAQLIWIFGYPLVFILLLRFGYGLEVYKLFAPGIVILAPIVLISQLAGHFATRRRSLDKRMPAESFKLMELKCNPKKSY